ncbi:MAG: ThuA domain-containing protein [Acidobacteriota bacterium]
MRVAAFLLWLSVSLCAAPKRVLFVTHSAGFVHGSIPAARQALESIASLEVVSTQDLSLISAEALRNFDAVFFFTSGELPLSDRQKADLLAFVRDGKGFGGAHSATDTLYTWPEYGEMIGAYFDGHPWAQEVSIDVEDPDHPATRRLGPSFRISDEIYQFRSFSRDRVRVLMTLDTRSVDMSVQGVQRTPGDFALAWCRNYGRGRVFYTALGHGDETWRDPRFRRMLEGALLWLAGEAEADARPRASTPRIGPGGWVNAAGRDSSEANAVAPGSLVSIFGEGLTSGSTMQAAAWPLPVKLAGTSVEVNGALIPLLYVSPGQINAQLPFTLEPGQASLVVRSATNAGAAELLRTEPAAPGIFAVVPSGDRVIIYATGLGAVQPALPAGAAAPGEPLSTTLIEPAVMIGGARATVLFSGLAPGFAGLYQVNATLPGPGDVVLEAAGRRSNAVPVAR